MRRQALLWLWVGERAERTICVHSWYQYSFKCRLQSSLGYIRLKYFCMLSWLWKLREHWCSAEVLMARVLGVLGKALVVGFRWTNTPHRSTQKLRKSDLVQQSRPTRAAGTGSVSKM